MTAGVGLRNDHRDGMLLIVPRALGVNLPDLGHRGYLRAERSILNNLDAAALVLYLGRIRTCTRTLFSVFAAFFFPMVIGLQVDTLPRRLGELQGVVAVHTVNHLNDKTQFRKNVNKFRLHMAFFSSNVLISLLQLWLNDQEGLGRVATGAVVHGQSATAVDAGGKGHGFLRWHLAVRDTAVCAWLGLHLFRHRPKLRRRLARGFGEGNSANKSGNGS